MAWLMYSITSDNLLKRWYRWHGGLSLRLMGVDGLMTHRFLQSLRYRLDHIVGQANGIQG